MLAERSKYGTVSVLIIAVMALPSPGASSFLIASIICIPKHCLKWVNPSGSRVLSHETGKEVESLQSNRHSSEHGPEHGPVEIE